MFKRSIKLRSVISFCLVAFILCDYFFNKAFFLTKFSIAFTTFTGKIAHEISVKLSKAFN